MLKFLTRDSWLKSFALLLYNIPIIIFINWQLDNKIGIFKEVKTIILPSDIDSISGEAGYIFGYLFVSYFIPLLINLIFYFLSLAYLYQLFWGKPLTRKYLRFLPSRSSIVEAEYKAFFSIVALVVAGLLSFPFWAVTKNEDFSTFLAVGFWIIISAYLWELRSRFKKQP